jgi:hypothetical protein
MLGALGRMRLPGRTRVEKMLAIEVLLKPPELEPHFVAEN